MLVLSRKEGERLVIGDNVVITVNRISGNRITLGIDAPRDIRIVRGELEPLENKAPEDKSPADKVPADKVPAGKVPAGKSPEAQPSLTFEADLATLGSRVAS